MSARAEEKQKALRSPRAKPGELKAKWGRVEGGEPDLCYAWGDGCSKVDARLLNWWFASTRERRDTREPLGMAFDPSFIEDLEKRGYDITTFRFSIQKKKP